LAAFLAIIGLISVPVLLVQGDIVHAFIGFVTGGFWSLVAWVGWHTTSGLRRNANALRRP
jgi:hypothetical protein